MMRRRRAWQLAGLTGALFTAILVLAHVVLMPRLLRQRVEEVLRSAGLTSIQFEVRRATLWGATLVNLDAGGGTSLQQLVLDYSPTSLLHGRVDAVRMFGAEVRISLGPTEIDAGPLGAAFMRPANPHASNGASRQTTPLPVPAIELFDSTLVVEYDGDSLRIPVYGRLSGGSMAPLDLSLTADLADGPLKIHGTINEQEQRQTYTLFADALDAGLVAAILRGVAGAPLDLRGAISVRSRVEIDSQHRRVEAELRPAELSLISGRPGNAGSLEPNPLAIDGVFRVEGNVSGADESRWIVRCKAGGLASDSFGLAATGIDGSVVLDDLSPPSTAAGQRLTVRSLKIGELELSNGLVEFDIESPSAIVVNAMRWETLGGTVSASNFMIDPTRPSANATLAMRDVDLRQLLDLLARGKAEGEGRVSGEITLAVDRANVRVRDGRLVASPGGRVTIKDQATLNAVTAGTREPAVQETLVQSLKDFQYDSLGAQLINEEDGLLAQIRLAGRGRGEAMPAIQYDLNIHDLDQLIPVALGIGMHSRAIRNAAATGGPATTRIAQ